MTVKEVNPLDGRTTRMWEVHDRHGGLLGHVSWYGRWRQYVFLPAEGCTFNKGCLYDISKFLDEQMRRWREEKQAQADSR